MENGKKIFWGIVIVLFAIYLLRDALGRLSMFFFAPFEQALFISHNIPPFLMWMIFGLSVGSVYGCFVSIKKFKLDYKLLILPIVILVSLLGLITLAFYIFDGSTPPPMVKVGDKAAVEKWVAFNENLRIGIRAVDHEEYTSAEYYFQKAVKVDAGNSQLDSLAKIYTQIGSEKCRMFRRKPRLKYLSNYYFKYAAVLTRKTPEICD